MTYIYIYMHSLTLFTIWLYDMYAYHFFYMTHLWNHGPDPVPRGHPACVTRFLSSWARIAAWKIRHGLVKTAVNSVLNKKKAWNGHERTGTMMLSPCESHPKLCGTRGYPWYPRQLSDFPCPRWCPGVAKEQRDSPVGCPSWPGPATSPTWDGKHCHSTHKMMITLP